MKKVVFVCVSNTCRSPMAEHLCREKLRTRGLDKEYEVSSRSISTDYEPEGSPASENGVLVMRDRYNIDMTSHRSTLLSGNDLHNLYAIVPVMRNLAPYIKQTLRLDESNFMFLDHDIPDPWRQSLDVFVACAADIDSMLDSLIDRLENK